jgi:hypothetical protein
MEKISRKEALARNLPYFFTGTKCKNGHTSKRATSSYNCFDCKVNNRESYNSKRRNDIKEKEKAKIRAKQYRDENVEKIKEYRRTDKFKSAVKNWKSNNKEKIQEDNRQWREENKEYHKKLIKGWEQKHPQRKRLACATRRAKKLKATPIWANKEEIKSIYDNCPAGCEVDHIIPLQNHFVCGLHVPNNLQYLTLKKNREKGNKFICIT